MDKSILKVDWATHKAANYACKKWHYSGCIPVGKLTKVGVLEHGKYIGVVLFGRGATPNLGKPYNLKQTECVELVRIALNKHHSTVSRIVSISIKFFKKLNPNILLIVSFADQSQGHNGAIYQAGNWIYTGTSESAKFYMINGKLTHPRSIGAKGFTQNIEGAKKIDKNATVIVVPGKHRYLMPLDKKTRSDIIHLSKPYPKKRLKQATSRDHLDSGGATPTQALHE